MLVIYQIPVNVFSLKICEVEIKRNKTQVKHRKRKEKSRELRRKKKEEEKENEKKSFSHAISVYQYVVKNCKTEKYRRKKVCRHEEE